MGQPLYVLGLSWQHHSTISIWARQQETDVDLNSEEVFHFYSCHSLLLLNESQSELLSTNPLWRRFWLRHYTPNTKKSMCFRGVLQVVRNKPVPTSWPLPLTKRFGLFSVLFFCRTAKKKKTDIFLAVARAVGKELLSFCWTQWERCLKNDVFHHLVWYFHNKIWGNKYERATFAAMRRFLFHLLKNLQFPHPLCFLSGWKCNTDMEGIKKDGWKIVLSISASQSKNSFCPWRTESTRTLWLSVVSQFPVDPNRSFI